MSTPDTSTSRRSTRSVPKPATALSIEDIADLVNAVDGDVSDLDGFDSDDDTDPTYIPRNETQPDSDVDDESLAEDRSENSPEPEVPLTEGRRVYWKHSNDFFPLPPAPFSYDEDDTPIEGNPFDFFKFYIPEEIYKIISSYSNQTYLASTGKDLKTTPEEIKKFFGIVIVMSYLKFPRMRMYWAATTRVPLICEQMPRERFLLIRRNLKLVNDATVPDDVKKTNKFWKVQPLIDKVRNACLQNPRPEKVSVDEQMIPFWGSGPARQYVRGKPNPCGLKNLVVTAVDGLPLDFFIYQGKGDSITTEPCCAHLNTGWKMVMKLTENLKEGSLVYMDRYFTSIFLLDLLHSERRMQGTGTLSANQLPYEVTLKSDRELAKEGRGSWDQVIRNDGQVTIMKWYDNKGVVISSSHEGAIPSDVCTRWDIKRKVYVDVQRPLAVKNYNSSMGGVDLLDRMISYYRISCRTRKWTIRLIFHLVDLSIVAAWLTYRRQQVQQQTPNRDKLDSFQYRQRIAERLIYASTLPQAAMYEDIEDDEEEVRAKKRKKTTPHPPHDLRTSMTLHMPTIPEKGKNFRCRMPGCSSNKARVKCSTCKMHLCFTFERNCFKQYHDKTFV